MTQYRLRQTPQVEAHQSQAGEVVRAGDAGVCVGSAGLWVVTYPDGWSHVLIDQDFQAQYEAREPVPAAPDQPPEAEAPVAYDPVTGQAQ